MWNFLTGGLSTVITSIATGVVGPVFTYLGKKQDVTLDGFKVAGGYDVQAFQAAASHEQEMAKLKIEANAWWGPRLLYMIVGGSMALHAAAVAIDSTFTFGTGHYGNLGVPPLPGVYATFEGYVVASLFVISTVGQLPNAVAAWLRK